MNKEYIIGYCAICSIEDTLKLDPNGKYICSYCWKQLYRVGSNKIEVNLIETCNSFLKNIK